MATKHLSLKNISADNGFKTAEASRENVIGKLSDRMKNIFYIIVLLTSSICYSQTKTTYVFNFDTSIVYINKQDLSPIVQDILLKYKSADTHSDSITLHSFELYQNSDSNTVNFRLEQDFFRVVNERKARIYFKKALVENFYTKEKKQKVNGNRFYEGVYYFDKKSKRHILTQTTFALKFCRPAIP